MSSAEKKLVEEKGLIDLLVESEIFYDQQFMEAKIVANVSTLYISVMYLMVRNALFYLAWQLS